MDFGSLKPKSNNAWLVSQHTVRRGGRVGQHCYIAVILAYIAVILADSRNRRRAISPRPEARDPNANVPVGEYLPPARRNYNGVWISDQEALAAVRFAARGRAAVRPARFFLLDAMRSWIVAMTDAQASSKSCSWAPSRFR